MQKTIFSEQGKAIRKAIVRIRKEAKMTQRDLAKKLGKRPSFVAHCELGERRVDLAEFYWICKACGASPTKESLALIEDFSKR